jgi:hypothetical protein
MNTCSTCEKLIFALWMLRCNWESLWAFCHTIRHISIFLKEFFYPQFYLQTVQMQVHLANGVMGGEAGRGAPISTLL